RGPEVAETFRQDQQSEPAHQDQGDGYRSRGREEEGVARSPKARRTAAQRRKSARRAGRLGRDGRPCDSGPVGWNAFSHRATPPHHRRRTLSVMRRRINSPTVFIAKVKANRSRAVTKSTR